MPQCICLRWFPTQKSLVHHRANQPLCKQRWTETILHRIRQTANYDPDDPEAVPRDDEPEGGFNPLTDAEMETLAEGFAPSPITIPEAHSATVPNTTVGPEVPYDLDASFIRHIVTHKNRSKTYGSGKTVFEKRLQEEKEKGMNAYREFKTAEIFEIAEWMLDSDLSQRVETRFLKTRMVCNLTH